MKNGFGRVGSRDGQSAAIDFQPDLIRMTFRHFWRTDKRMYQKPGSAGGAPASIVAFWRKRYSPAGKGAEPNQGTSCSRKRRWQRALLGVPPGLMLLLAACATPIRIERIHATDVHRELTRNVISTGSLSGPTQIVLDRQDLATRFKRDPETAMAVLHSTVAAGQADPENILFALAETSFRHAEQSGKRPYYLAAAIYAYAFLFPDDPMQRPSPFDPRFRVACDLYNRGLTSSFASSDRSRVTLQSGRFALPFGTINIIFDPAGARWGNLALTDFAPADELRVTGLRDRYRRPGMGASLAASAMQPITGDGLQIASELKYR